MRRGLRVRWRSSRREDAAGAARPDSGGVVMETVLVLLQVTGAVAMLVGVALWLPLGLVLAVDGALVLVLATAAEAARRRAHRQDRGGGPP